MDSRHSLGSGISGIPGFPEFAGFLGSPDSGNHAIERDRRHPPTQRRRRGKRSLGHGAGPPNAPNTLERDRRRPPTQRCRRGKRRFGHGAGPPNAPNTIERDRRHPPTQRRRRVGGWAAGARCAARLPRCALGQTARCAPGWSVTGPAAAAAMMAAAGAAAAADAAVAALGGRVGGWGPPSAAGAECGQFSVGPAGGDSRRRRESFFNVGQFAPGPPSAAGAMRECGNAGTRERGNAAQSALGEKN